MANSTQQERCPVSEAETAAMLGLAMVPALMEPGAATVEVVQMAMAAMAAHATAQRQAAAAVAQEVPVQQLAAEQGSGLIQMPRMEAMPTPEKFARLPAILPLLSTIQVAVVAAADMAVAAVAGFIHLGAFTVLAAAVAAEATGPARQSGRLRRTAARLAIAAATEKC